jgi:hypothetical protein
MIKPKYLLAMATSALAWALHAQPPGPPPAPSPRDTMFFVAGRSAVMPFGGQIDVLGGEGSVMGGVVKDKPYSASSITESTRVLADGNRIVNRNEAKTYRDSQGRTRRDQTLGGLGVFQTATEPLTMITINDPVADKSYFIDPTRRTVRELKPFRLAFDATGTTTAAGSVTGAVAGNAEHHVIVENGSVTSGVVESGPGDVTLAAPAVPFDLAIPPPGAALELRRAVRGARVAATGGAPTFAMAATFDFPGGETTTEDLGDQVLEGVLARGTRHTQTIPPGAIGNERAIEVVAEQWYSKDIEAVVLRRNVDPRFGETTYRLVNLVRGEPSSDLFAVPDGYETLSEPPFPPQPPAVGLRALPSDAPGEPLEGRVERRVFMVQPGSAESQR